MRSLAGKIGCVAIFGLVMAGATWGQEFGASLSGGVETRKFDSIRILQDVKTSQQSGAQGGAAIAL